MTSYEQNNLPFFATPCMVKGKMNRTHRHFFGFTFRYWRSVAALADVHI
jgi:hypothetical protein